MELLKTHGISLKYLQTEKIYSFQAQGERTDIGGGVLQPQLKKMSGGFGK